MNTEITDAPDRIAGWLFYDADCDFCCAWARRGARLLARRRFELRPLQSPDAAKRLGRSGSDLLREMHLLLADGRVLGGADAILEIARRVGWARPFVGLSGLPGVRPFLRAAYRVIAANRRCRGGPCALPRRPAGKRDPGGAPRRHAAFLELP